VRAAVFIALFDFLALGALGVFFPYFSMYLHSTVGLSATQTGLVFAITPATGMLAHPLWGQLADRSGSRTRVLALVSFGAAAGFVLLGQLDGFWPLALGTAVMALFMTAIIPLAVSITLATVQDLGRHAYGLVRVWGTVGFLVSVVAFPRLLASTGAQPGDLSLMMPAAALLFASAGLVALALPRGKTVSARAEPHDYRLLLSEPSFLRMLLFILLAYLFLQGPMSLFPLFVESLGGGVNMVSDMWIIMLLLELPLVAMIGMVQQKVGARGLLAIGLLSGSARWLVSAWSNDLNIVYAAQLLHGVTVMGLILGAPLYVDAVVPARLRSTAQGVLAMAGVSLGGVLSNLMTGWMSDALGPRSPALAGGLGALLLALAMSRLLPPLADSDPSHDGRDKDNGLANRGARTGELPQPEQSVEAGI